MEKLERIHNIHLERGQFSVDYQYDTESSPIISCDKSLPSLHNKLPTPSTGATEAPTPAPPPEIELSPTSLSTREARQVIASFPTSPANPINWTTRKKWTITAILALTGFISTVGSSIGVPGLHAVMSEFEETNEKIGVLIAGAYVLGLGTGPFVFAPVSELYGRQVAYVSSQIFYVLFTLGTGFTQSMAALIVLRFFCGCFASPPPSLGVATCADMFLPHERGKPISLYALGPISGPIIGNMVGYWLLFGGWRWAYYFMTIVAFLNFILMVLFLRETYAPAIQKIMTYRVTHPLSLATSSRRHCLPDMTWMTAMVSKEDAKTVYVRAFSRPPRLLFTNPVAFAFSLYYAYVYGIIYLFLVALPLLYGKPPFSQPILFSYKWPLATMGLPYISMGLGFISAVVIASQCQDRIYKHLSKLNGDKGQPEYRLVLTQIGMCIMPIGLFIFGWTAQAEVHWMGPFMGQAVMGIGLMLAFNTIQNFFVDAFYPYSAAAVAGATAARSVVACIMPLFTTTMFVKLGWGWGGTLIACIAIVGIPAPMIMFFFGQRLREHYAFQG
ncbi:hypothetical protein I308_101798 [Cryptococcus tetragattii IND107]|uniref:Major facilitator superfamily (MFS) profile domain-containing protein n=1 Tax=Cryptococcus tetragattii IND107 TaxID=1296105 RepID=A0ABR3BVK3_9TREE|nr:hypothetical protein I308_02659 [Cryptococcus tetragattii IND107]